MIAREQVIDEINRLVATIPGADDYITDHDVARAADRILAADAPSPAVIERLRLTGRGKRDWDHFDRTVQAMEDDHEHLAYEQVSPAWDDELFTRTQERKDTDE